MPKQTEQAPDLGEYLKKDLLLVKQEMDKPESQYIVSYCLYVGIVDINGEVVHITGLQTLEPENLVGRLEMAKHSLIRNHQKHLNQEEDLEIKPEVHDLLRQFKVNQKDKPN